MSGKTWAQIKEEEAVKMQDKFQRLNPDEAQFITGFLLELMYEPMTRSSTKKLDEVLNILGIFP